jgi:hypothetical protein
VSEVVRKFSEPQARVVASENYITFLLFLSFFFPYGSVIPSEPRPPLLEVYEPCKLGRTP